MLLKVFFFESFIHFLFLVLFVLFLHFAFGRYGLTPETHAAVGELVDLLAGLLPAVVHMPLTLELLNEARMNPRKNSGSNRLEVSTRLQHSTTSITSPPFLVFFISPHITTATSLTCLFLLSLLHYHFTKTRMATSPAHRTPLAECHPSLCPLIHQ
jgi:hypothetical protein